MLRVGLLADFTSIQIPCNANIINIFEIVPLHAVKRIRTHEIYTLPTGYDAFASVVFQRVYVFTCPSNSLTVWNHRYCACVLSVNAIMPARNKNTNVHVRINTCRTSYG